MVTPETELARDVHPSTDARQYMVDCQLRPNRVTDRRVLDAMRRLPREHFVPAAMRAVAYTDVEVPLGPAGRFMLPPVAVARLVQAAGIALGDNVLVIGAGYAAALLAAMGAAVTAVEEDPGLLASATAAYAAAGVAVAVRQGRLAEGWPDGGRYACILVDGAVPRLPSLDGQLRDRPPGRLCAVVVGGGRSGQAMIAEADPLGSRQPAARVLFDCTATPMPQFDLPRAFAF